MAATALGNIPLSTTIYPSADVDAALSGLASGVSEEIASAVSTAWKAGGSKAPTDLTSSLLVAANEGKVYNMSASGTTDTNFVEGSGKPYLAGTDIAVINTGTASSPVYKFNVLATQDSSVVKGLTVSGGDVFPSNGKIRICGNGAITVAAGSGSDQVDISIPLVSSSGDGVMTSGMYDKLSGIASGAEVNQNAFSKIAVDGVTGTGDADSKTDTLVLVPGTNVTMTRDGKSVTINAAAAPESSGFANITVGDVTVAADSAADTVTFSGTAPIAVSGDATNDKVTFSHAICGPSMTGDSLSAGDTTNKTPAFGATFKALSATVDKYGHVSALDEHTVKIPSATATATQNGLMSSTDKNKLGNIASGANIGFNTVHGTNETSASITSGDTNLVMLGTNISASVYLQSGTEGPVVVDLSVPDGSTTTKGVVKIASSISDQGTVVPTASMVSTAIAGITHPVTDGKISGGSSLLSGTTIVIPVASTSTKGVTQLTDSVSNSTTTAITPNAVSGAISGVNSGLATKVSGGTLHTALSGSGLANGVGSGNNTIYALINALHSVDGQSES